MIFSARWSKLSKFQYRFYHLVNRMSQNFLLDLLVDEAQFAGCIRSRGMPVWLVIKADGVGTSIATKPVAPSTARFQLPVRWVLNLMSLESAYLKISLHSSGDPNYNVILASAQIRLSDIATRPAQNLTFPLLLHNNTTVEAALITIQANVSPLNFRTTVGTFNRTDVQVRPELSQTYRSAGPKFPPIGEMEMQRNVQWNPSPPQALPQIPPMPPLRFTGRGFDWALNH